MKKTRDLFFELKKQNNPYLSDQVIKSLLCYVGDFSFDDYVFDLEMELDEKKLNKLVERIKKGEPLQYVTNEAYFLSNKFYVDSNVLIPRQETEQLVIETIKRIDVENPVIFDIGTGSGCIIVSIAKSLKSRCFACDIDKKCLKIASQNAKDNQVDVTFLKSDILKSVPTDLKCDVIISNPPYILDESTVDPSTLKYEPHLALFAKPQTLFYDRIMKEAHSHLNNHYLIAFEIEENLEADLTKIANSYFPGAKLEFIKDIYGKTRFMFITK